MKNFRMCFLAAVLVVTALAVAGQRSFAEFAPQYNGTGLNATFQTLFGSTANMNQVSHSGVFDVATTSIFQISASPSYGIPTNGLFTSALALVGNNVSNVSGYSTYLAASTDLSNRAISFSGSGAFTISMYSHFGSNQVAQFYSDLGTLTAGLNGGGSWSVARAAAHNALEISNFVYFQLTAQQLAAFNLGGYTIAPGTVAYLVGFDEGITGFNFSGNYNSAVFLVLTGAGSGPDPSGVPEPATLFLWTLSGLGLAGASWKRNRFRK